MASEYLDNMDLESKISGFTAAEQFLARQQFALSEKVDRIEKNCVICPGKKQKAFNYSGLAGFLAALGLVFWQVVEYMRK